MGSLILCHKKRAKQPYVISRVHMKIYTIEELCYYICNNLYLIDYTIINHQLCDWIGRELEMEELSEHLKAELRKNCSMEQFILTILRESTSMPSQISTGSRISWSAFRTRRMLKGPSTRRTA